VSPDGGTPVALVTDTDNGAIVAVDDTHAYWFGPDDGTVLKVALVGGSAVTLVKNLTNDPIDLAIDGTGVYWDDGQLIRKVGLDGGAAPTLATGLDLSAVYQQPNLAVGPDGVYATTESSVLRVPLDGGAATTLATGQAAVAVTADATTVYWLNIGGAGPASVVKTASDGGAPVTLATLGKFVVPQGIAVDATNVYWIEAAGQVMKIPLAGGTPVALAVAPEEPGGIAVDSTSVYWTDTSGGNVLKTAK
jgi:hypothetical protein